MKNRCSPISSMLLIVSLLAGFISCDTNETLSVEVSGLQAAAVDGHITLTWHDPDGTAVDHIEITWTPDGPAAPTEVAPGIQTAVITGLTNGTEYSFTVRTEDADGELSDGVTVSATPGVAGDFYVALDGNDSNPGTQAEPWRTVQKAAGSVPAGSTVYVRGGIYNEQVTVEVSGSADAGYITFRNAAGETPVLDGTGLTVPDKQSGMLVIADRSYIIVRGFEIRNYRSSTRDVVPIGVHIRGTSHHIQLSDCRIHHIETNTPVDFNQSGADAHGIAVFGTAAPSSVNNITIDGNELYDLKLGSSEALVLNGNVDTFIVSNNIIHDVNNIGIDIIGFEGTSPLDQYDQARNGRISSNLIYNASSFGNPAYGNNYSAGGIYVDGGRDTVIEMNTVYNCDIGIEIASEHASRATSRITVRSNFLYYNALKGISMGGYDRKRGSTENCAIVNNTLYRNNTLQDGSAEIGIMFDTRNNILKNNIFYANEQSFFVDNNFTENTGNAVDYNIYFASAGKDNSSWEWKNLSYRGFDEYTTATGNDAHSLFIDPVFADPDTADLHLSAGSPAIDRGENIPETGTKDIDGQDRVQGSLIDIGADEHQ